MIAEVWRAVFGEMIPGPHHRRTGPDQYRVLCPFHHDNHPSCDVSLAKNVFLCRSCGAKGNSLDVVILAGFAADRRQAAQWLEPRLG
jgi:hypothetical protein